MSIGPKAHENSIIFLQTYVNLLGYLHPALWGNDVGESSVTLYFVSI